METPQLDLVQNLPGNQDVEQATLMQLFKNAGMEVHQIRRQSDDGLRRITVLPGRYDDRIWGYKRALRMRTAESGHGSYAILDGISSRYAQLIRGNGVEPPTRKLNLDRITFASYQLGQIEEHFTSYTEYRARVNPNFHLTEAISDDEQPKQQLRLIITQPVEVAGSLMIHGLYFEPVVRVALADAPTTAVYSLTNHGNYGWLVRRTHSE